MGDDSSSNLGEQCMANIPTIVHDAEYKDCTTIQKRPEEAQQNLGRLRGGDTIHLLKRTASTKCA